MSRSRTGYAFIGSTIARFLLVFVEVAQTGRIFAGGRQSPQTNRLVQNALSATRGPAVARPACPPANLGFRLVVETGQPGMRAIVDNLIKPLRWG